MSQITDGLANDGDTKHFSISYEESLSPADGRVVAQGLVNVIEDDFELVLEWFAGTEFKYAFPINVELHNASTGASWTPPPDITAGIDHPTVRVGGVLDPTGAPNEQGLDYVRYLIVSEVTEMYMASKDNGWHENTTLTTTGDEGSKGEGLSIFLAHQFRLAKGIAGPFSDYEPVRLWLGSSTRPNYLEGSPDDTNKDIVTGGTSAFLYYLHNQLNYPIPAIINAGSTTLAEVYTKLTGRNDAWASYSAFVEKFYPVGTSQDDVGDDAIFPVANLEGLSDGVSVVASKSNTLYLSLDRVTPVSVTVQLTSDDPAILTVSPSVKIQHGQMDREVSVTALPIAGGPHLVTVHATYAGKTVNASVLVKPHASVLGGVVSDAVTGSPVENAVVLVDGEAGKTSLSHVHIQLLTGSNGFWKTGDITPDTYDLEVTAPGYVPSRASVVVAEGVPVTQWNIALTASQPFTLRGTARDQAGAPLSGVAVILADDGEKPPISTTTASDGTYSFTQDPGLYTGGYTLSAKASGHKSFQVRIPTIANGATVLEDLILPAFVVLTGTIKGPNGAAPLAGATVSDGDETATSDASGRYTLELLPGSISVKVSAVGYEYANASVTVAAAGATEQDFTLVAASATLTGTVLDGTTGLAVRHAFVRVDGAGSAKASPDGAYSLSLVPAGPAQVTATAHGYRAETIPVTIVAHETSSLDIYLAAEGPRPPVG